MPAGLEGTPPGWSRRDSARVLAVATLLVATFWLLRIVLPGEKPPGFLDLLTYYYPHYQATFERFASGELPRWNPYQLTGVPWLPALQIGPFYPPHLVYAALPTGAALGSMSLFHFLLAGASMVFLARYLGLCASAGVLAAALFTMRGLFSFQSVVPNVLETAVWIIPGTLASLAIARGAGARAVALLGLATGASLLAGYPQLTVYSAYTWSALFGVLVLQGRPGWPARGWAALRFAAGIVLGAAIASIQLLPTFAASREATRQLSALTPEQMFPLGWEPSFAGAVGELLAARHGDLTFSLGAVGIALLPFAFVPREQRVIAGAFVGLGLLAMGIALGPASPLFDAYLWLPPMASFRTPGRVLFVRDFAFAIAAALGVHGLRQLLLARWPGRRAAMEAVTAGVVGLALLELFTASPIRPRLPYFDPRDVARYHARPAIYEALAQSSQRVLLWNPYLYPPLPSKLGSLHRFRALDDFEPMALRRQAEYFSYVAHGRIPSERSNPIPFYGKLELPTNRAGAHDWASRQRLLDLASTRFVLGTAQPRPDEALEAYVGAAALVARDADAGLALYENPAALPRAYVTHHVLPAPATATLLEKLADPGFDPREQSYAEGSLALDADPPTPPTVRILEDGSSVVELEATLSAPGLLVLADAYHPGWRATVDGRPAEILPTNHLFRGVALASGRHSVRFEYHVAGLGLGATVSAAGIAIAVALARRKRRTAA